MIRASIWQTTDEEVSLLNQRLHCQGSLALMNTQTLSTTTVSMALLAYLFACLVGWLAACW